MIITLTGPTCAGKSELEECLVQLGLRRAISHTTRARRPGERNGVDYHFVTEAEFRRMEHTGLMVETNEFGGFLYGKSVQELHADGSCVAVIEPNGALNVARHCRSHEIPLLAVWIECSPKIQAARWIDRVSRSFLSLGGHTERLAAMLGVERHWRAQMAGLANVYLSSDDASPEELAECVIEAARSLTGARPGATIGPLSKR